jgi:DNA-binding transcriptional ArsR family regulator
VDTTGADRDPLRPRYRDRALKKLRKEFYGSLAPPPVRRLSAGTLGNWLRLNPCRALQAADISWRLDVAKQLLQFVGWRGRGQVSLAELASAAEVSDDTVGRALNDLEQLGLVRRHHLLKRDPDGRTVQDASFFELKALPPESDPQTAGDRIPYGLGLAFLAWKRSLGGLGALATKASKELRKDSPGLLGGDDAYGRCVGDQRKTATQFDGGR